MASALEQVNQTLVEPTESLQTVNFNTADSLLPSSQGELPPGPVDPITPTPTPPMPTDPTVEDTNQKLQDLYSNVPTDDTLSIDKYDPEAVTQDLDKTGQFKEGSAYIDQANNTVAGQLDKLLASDSPYIKQQEDTAMEKAQSRGMLNTTLAQQAGRNAAISAALPIAQQDAQTAADFNKAQQAGEINAATSEKEAVLTSAITEHRANIERQSKNIDNKFTSMMKSADEQSKALLGDLQARYQKDLSIFEGVLRERIMDKEIDSNRKQLAFQSASAIMQNYQVTVENMMTNPSFLELGSENINNAINQVQNLAMNQINFIGNSVGLDFTDLTDFYFEDLTAISEEYEKLEQG